MMQQKLVGYLLLCLASSVSFGAEVKSSELNEWLDNEFLEYLDFYPQSKKRYGIDEGYDQLNDASLAHRKKVLAWRRASTKKMQDKFDRATLSQQEKISFDLWSYLYEREAAAWEYRYHRYIFGRRGPHTSLPRSLIGNHKVTSRQDMLDYIERLRSVERYLGQFLDRAQESAKRGIRAPHFDYAIAEQHSRKVVTGAPFTDTGEAALWTDINKKLAALVVAEEIDDAEADRLRRQARRALLEQVDPAYQRLISWLAADAKKVSKEATGASVLPDGDAYYQSALNFNTTLQLSAEEIHETGLREVARLHAEMREIKKAVEFDGDLKQFFVHLRESDEYFYPSTDEGRERYLELARSYLAGIEKKLPEYFGVLPKAGLEVRRVEAYREQPGGSAHYFRGAVDGSRPGIFYAHLIDMRAAAVYRLENLAYHEGLPGHHMQISIQQELTDLPRFRTHHGFTAFSEGWGLYSEYLGKEMGFYVNPYNDFGRLSGELWRSIRLVVDTGIHSQGWTEEQAAQYGLNNSPYPEVKIRSEIRRYFNNPAQATAYKIGMLKILELRRRAEQVLGDKFDIRGFHDTVIGSGPLPLEVLDRRISEWIEAQG